MIKSKRFVLTVVVLALLLVLFVAFKYSYDDGYHLLGWKYLQKIGIVNKRSESDFGITRIIHQSWKSKNVLPVFEKYRKTWTKFCYPRWKYMFWTDEDNLNLIRTHYPWFLKKYNELPANIYRADVSRYFYLFHYGGIYTDMDNECLKPFEFLLTNYSFVFGAMVGQYGAYLKEGYVQNSFMYSKPRLEFWLELIIEVLNFKERSSPEAMTGPVLLTKKIGEYQRRKNGTKELVVYPPHYFNPFSWLDGKGVDKNCKSHNRMSEEEYEKCRTSMIKKGSYVVQYHAHTWGNTFQSGFLSILFSIGTNPLQIWDKKVRNGHIKRISDNDIQSLVIELMGTNISTTFITCPCDPKVTLGIKLPYMILIVKNLKKYFSFEVQILDDKNVRRRFRASNYQSTTRVKPFICTMPLRLDEGWNQIHFNLADFNKRAYGTNYVETLRIQVHANCRIRRIYFSDKLYSEEELPPEFKLYLPIQQKSSS